MDLSKYSTAFEKMNYDGKVALKVNIEEIFFASKIINQNAF